MSTQAGWPVRTLSLAVWIALASLPSPSPAQAAAGPARPNVLFIMADDHTTQAFGCYGSRLAALDPTPHIDRLAAEGMRFDRVFCTNSICTPSRASILTGQHPQTHGVLDLDGGIAPPDQHLAREMGRAGYHTAMIGKWHLKHEPAAFDHYCVLPGQGRYFDPEFRVRGERPWPQNVITARGMHSSTAITDQTLAWLETGWDRARPFFVMHHFKAPHDLFQNDPRYDDYLADVDVPEPTNLYGQPAPGQGSVATRGVDDALVSVIGASVTRRCGSWELGRRLGVDPSLPEPEYGRQVYQTYLKRYLRCVKGVDDAVGRLLDYLRAEELLDDTVVLYTSDQGLFLGEHDLMDKRWMYEEAFRMPLVVRYPPRIAPGSTSGWLINNTDFAPTILELAGAAAPEFMQGRSFAAALAGGPAPDDWRTTTYYRYWMHMAHELGTPAHFGVRSERYKLIFFYGSDFAKVTGFPERPRWGVHANADMNRFAADTPPAWEFYDLEKDPLEMRNEYANPAYRDVIARLKDELREQRRELGETDAAYPHLRQIIEAHWDD
jgi:arylsulfatase A-like enzyme